MVGQIGVVAMDTLSTTPGLTRQRAKLSLWNIVYQKHCPWDLATKITLKHCCVQFVCMNKLPFMGTRIAYTPAALTQCGDSTAMQASHLYNAMIAPLLNQTIKGAIWWQGESNGGAPVKYGCQLPAMIEQWRQGWHAGSNGQTAADFPFGVVQLSSVIPVVGGFSFFIKKRLKRRRRRKQNEKEGPCVMLRE